MMDNVFPQHKKLPAKTFLLSALLLMTVYDMPVLAQDQVIPQTATFKSTVEPFLTDYCVRCHGLNKKSGERRFDQLTGFIDGDNTLVDLQDILDQLNLGEMPPVDEKQPTNAERRQVIAWLTRAIKEYHEQHQVNLEETVLRRLNSREYRNTVRDLLHLNMTMFDPTVDFPKDQTSDHLDNIGNTLVTSGYLLDRYLSAAELVIDKALTPAKKPKIQTWAFRDGFRQQPEIDQVFRKVNNFEWMTLFDVAGADKHEGAYGPIHAFAEGVPHDGYYEIRIKAEAANRRHPYDPEFLGTDPREPLRLGIVAGNHLAGPLHKPQPIEPLLAEIDLADEQKWYTVRVWMDAGFTPRFTFQNGLMDARNLWSQLLRKYKDQFPERKNNGIVEARFNAIKYGKLPQIRIHEVEIEGPFYDSWPLAKHNAIWGEHWETALQTGTLTDQQIRKHLTTFASRAYRRPAKDEEVDRIMRVIATRKAAGHSSLEAYGDGLKTVLCSPNFLYLEESVENRLSSTALASRLSYFLWSSMPDQQLMSLAISNQLQNPQVLEEQVERMLDAPKSEAFINDFLDSWLTLRDLGSTPPDRSQFRSFYHYDLGTAMRTETRMFASDLLKNNLAITNFLDSDYTFANRPMARLYGIQPPAENGFHRVSLTNGNRGGLFGQASVLTVTANGIDTSPVVRGVWLLENIFGTPPSPPPPDVEPLDPDIRGATTIREQLKKHRSVASCNDCHRKIDPMGFALEHFDPIGKYRTVYKNKAKIDGSGQLPNGKQFESISDLKKILVEQKEQFATALTTKLITYAIGRPITPADRPHIDQITEELTNRGLGFRDLIRLVATSDLFAHRQ